MRLPIQPTSGDVAQKMVQEIYAIPSAVVERARGVFQ
jgi:hypothetical protein